MLSCTFTQDAPGLLGVPQRALAVLLSQPLAELGKRDTRRHAARPDPRALTPPARCPHPVSSGAASGHRATE